MPSEPASTADSSLRMSPNRFSVTTTSMSRGCGHQVHREGVDERVVERHRRVLRGHRGHRLAPQLAGDQHVGLVHRGEPAAALARPARRRRGPRARSRRGCTRWCRTAAAPVAVARLPEVGAAGELAHHHQVDAAHHLGAQRGALDQARVHAHRAQVGEHPQRGAQPEQPGLAALVAAEVVPLRPADGAEQHGVGRPGRRRASPPAAACPSASMAAPPMRCSSTASSMPARCAAPRAARPPPGR